MGDYARRAFARPYQLSPRIPRPNTAKATVEGSGTALAVKLTSSMRQKPLSFCDSNCNTAEFEAAVTVKVSGVKSPKLGLNGKFAAVKFATATPPKSMFKNCVPVPSLSLASQRLNVYC